MTQNLLVEYLFISKLDEAICTTSSEFKNMIQSVKGIKVIGNKVEFEGKKLDVVVSSGDAEEGKSIYFNITISAQEEDIASLVGLCKKLRTIINKVTGDPPQTLWDDVGFHYCKLAYPKILEIENLLRKLITKFMIINTGASWHRLNVPKEVDQSIKNKATNDYLHAVDFIQLSVLMFKEYSTVNTKPIIDKIRKAKDISSFSMDELKTLSPLSNWDRYFKPILNCEADYLSSRWEKLYELRNMVAHNKPIKQSDYESIISIINEIEPIITEAITKLNEVSIPTEEKEDLLENAASATSNSTMWFLREVNQITENLYDLVARSSRHNADTLLSRRHSPIVLAREALKMGVIHAGLYESIADIITHRNELVHSSNTSYTESEMKGRLEGASYINSRLQNIYWDGYLEDKADDAAMN